MAQHHESDLYAKDPILIPEDNPAPPSFPPWIHHNACATLYLQGMEKPERARLLFDNEADEWAFRPGRKETNPKRPLPDFASKCCQLIKDKRLFEGHVKFSIVATARRSRIMTDMIASSILQAKHVSASTLENISAPILSQHHNLSPNDKQI